MPPYKFRFFSVLAKPQKYGSVALCTQLYLVTEHNVPCLFYLQLQVSYDMTKKKKRCMAKASG